MGCTLIYDLKLQFILAIILSIPLSIILHYSTLFSYYPQSNFNYKFLSPIQILPATTTAVMPTPGENPTPMGLPPPRNARAFAYIWNKRRRPYTSWGWKCTRDPEHRPRNPGGWTSDPNSICSTLGCGWNSSSDEWWMRFWCECGGKFVKWVNLAWVGKKSYSVYECLKSEWSVRRWKRRY